jgi:hypothetical protein
MKFDNDNLFQAARDLRQRQLAAERYMRARKIGESAVDLIPPEIRHPCGPIRTNDGMYWTHTPGILKLTAWFVRLAWSRA